MDLPLLTQELGARDLRAGFYEQLANVVLPPATDVSLGEIPTAGDAGGVMIEVTNTGANPLTGFHLAAIPTPNSTVAAGNVYPDYITNAQFNAGAAIGNLLVMQSANPTTLAAGATVLICVRANGAWRLQPRATSTLGTTVTITACVGKS